MSGLPPQPPGAAEDGGFESRVRPFVVSAALAGATLCWLLAELAQQPRRAQALALGCAPLALALWLVSRRRGALGLRLSLATLLALSGWLLWAGDGLRDVVLMLWPALLLAAGLLLPTLELYLFSAGSLGACGIVVALQARGGLPLQSGRPDPAAWSDFAVVSVVLMATTICVDALARSLRRTLAGATAERSELRASEERFTRAFRASPAVMAITRISDGVVIDVNDAFERATMRTRDEAVGRPILELGLWVDPEQREVMFEALQRKGSVNQQLMRYHRRGGGEGTALMSGYVVELDGEPCALFAAIDVTEARRAEQALQGSEERYRLISKVTTDYSFSTLIDERGQTHIDWVAGAFEAITGYSFEDYVARGGWRAALHPDDLEQDRRDLEQLGRREAVVSELRVLRPDGEQRWVRAYAHPVWDDELGRLVGIYGAVTDITEQRRAAAERETLIRELEAKNAELERFTYTVSHDLKSPLITMRGFLTHVEKAIGAGQRERALADVERIRAASERMWCLLDELLALSRIGRVADAPEAVPFGELAREAVALSIGRLEERGGEVEIEAELPEVRGDRSRLVEVLQNLIDNSVKFTPPARQPKLRIGARRAEDGPVFYVSDEGCGLEPEHLDRVFGLFDKLDPRSEGTGIGLALVRRIIEVHGGRVWVESEGLDRGSRFCFTLPG